MFSFFVIPLQVNRAERCFLIDPDEPELLEVTSEFVTKQFYYTLMKNQISTSTKFRQLFKISKQK